jgi:hypothetical protein
MTTATANEKVFNIAPGIDIVVENYTRHNEETAMDLVHRCKVIVLKRDQALARLKELIEQAAKVADDDQRYGVHPLDSMCEAIGWISNFTTHTNEHYRKALIALADTLDDDTLVDALDSAEFYMSKDAQQ